MCKNCEEAYTKANKIGQKAWKEHAKVVDKCTEKKVCETCGRT